MAKASAGLMQNVEAVRASGLCMGCGTCGSVCPQSAVSMKLHGRTGSYVPYIDRHRCVQCGLCVRVCPGASVDFAGLAGKFLRSSIQQDDLIGCFGECYIGHSSLEHVRYQSASGGITTSLLIYALEHDLIDGALVTAMSPASALETKPCIVTTRDEVIVASGSKYCPSSTNEALRQLLATKGRYAVVGLPCHIHAIRKWQMMDPHLRERVILLLGLFCANNNTYLGTEYFLKQNGIRPAQVSEIRYRAEGWPGKIRVALRSGEVRILPRATTEKKWYRKALFASAFHYDFMIPRCLLCADQTSELADVSLGDPWLPEYRKADQIGSSLVISRTKAGSDLLKEAIRDGAVQLKEVELGVVRRAQNYSFKKNVGSRIRMRAALRRPVPDYGDRDLPSSNRGLLGAFRYLPSYVSHHRWLWPAIRLFAFGHYLQRAAVQKGKRAARLLLRLAGIRRFRS